MDEDDDMPVKLDNTESSKSEFKEQLQKMKI